MGSAHPLESRDGRRSATVLELRGITKRFPGIVANDHIDFDLRRGEVHALLGENGAGKSTLMNVLYGLYRADEGEILINGQPVTFRSPKDAIEHGIGMVHQHFMLIPVMTVAENIVLGVEPSEHGVLLDYGAARERVRDLASTFGFAIDPDALVEDITVGQQQRVEILKALYRKADILMLDEPTAVLTPQEARRAVRDPPLAADARASRSSSSATSCHEVLEIADRVTVLRRGKRIETLPVAGATEQSLARLMVGREVLLQVEKTPRSPGETLLQVDEPPRQRRPRHREGARACRSTCTPARSSRSPGVDGNGQTELIDALTGLRTPTPGRVEVAGNDVTARDRARSTSRPGVGHIPAGPAAARARPRLHRSPRTSRCTISARRPTRASAGSIPLASSSGRDA